MLHRGALSHFVDPSAQGHLASDKWRILDAGPDLKSARLESRLEALGSGVTGPGPLSEPHSACFPWLACPVPTHVCLQATGQKRSQELLVPKDRPRQSLDEDSPAGLAAPPGTPLPMGCPSFSFVVGFPAISLGLWEAAGPTMHMISVTLAETHVILAWAHSRDETGLHGHL